MFKEIDKNIYIADPFIYRIDPEDYISITESLLINRKLFQEIDKAKESLVAQRKDENMLKKHSSILKRWKTHQPDEIEKLYEDFDVYRYFYKEVGASLKFNPLSKRESGVHVLEKILELLNEYISLIKPKVVYTVIDIKPDDEGLQVKGSDIHFDSRRLIIFTSHSSIKSNKEISPKELISEKVIVYVVTIGPGIDNEVKSFSFNGNIFEAYLLNGIGAGAAEMVANDLNLYMNDNCDKKKCSYKRLSPGYGDWPVTDQKKIFRLLNPEKNIGVILTESHIMIPE
ncbi:MAG: vitamin B12 dependent-methionine synthase activation domain-containing protein, partial [Ignavibacteria bacterium]|nr:vitamin B12 dependent-methionine synthase activation domain-containing protein [Ignavibacteria bacterium]